MPAYATLTDATTLYSEDYVLTSVDRDGDGKPDYDAFSASLAQASSEMDTYLGARYDVPIAPVPPILVRYAVDIAIYQASSTYGGGLTEEKRKRYDDALKWLTNAAKGIVSLGLSQADETTTQENLPQVASSNPERIFTRTRLGGL